MGDFLGPTAATMEPRDTCPGRRANQHNPPIAVHRVRQGRGSHSPATPNSLSPPPPPTPVPGSAGNRARPGNGAATPRPETLAWLRTASCPAPRPTRGAALPCRNARARGRGSWERQRLRQLLRGADWCSARRAGAGPARGGSSRVDLALLRPPSAHARPSSHVRRSGGLVTGLLLLLLLWPCSGLLRQVCLHLQQWARQPPDRARCTVAGCAQERRAPQGPAADGVGRASGSRRGPNPHAPPPG